MGNSAVSGAYGYALRRLVLFTALYFSVQVLAYAVIVPVIGMLVRLAVSLSSQSALTDQDIAGFFLHPVGLVVAIALIAVLLVAEVLGFALAASAQASGETGLLRTIRAAYRHVAGKLARLIRFAVFFVLRVLLLIVPFAAVAGWIFLRYLTEFDINYYLATRPPEFLWAGGLIALILGLGAILLLIRLASWSMAVHNILFADCAAGQAFAVSAKQTEGARMHIARDVALWLLVRLVAGAVIGWIIGALANLVPIPTDGGLRLTLILISSVALLWALANLVLGAVSIAALARVLGTAFAAHAPTPPRTSDEHIARPALAALVLAGLAIGGLIVGLTLMGTVAPRDQVEIIAHRGGASARPENTVAAIEKGLEDGADWIEIDVQETVDGEIAVIHDSDFMKLSGVDLKIWDASLADLEGIDIGSWFSPDYADQRTPLLRDVLEMVRDRSKLLIELKYYGHDVALEQRVADIVDAAGMSDQIAVMSLKYAAVEKVIDMRPDWRTGVLAATAIGDLRGLKGDFVALNAAMATPGRIRAAHDAGKSFYVWTINDPLEMSRMISKGVDGLITDEPLMAGRVIAFRAGLSTPERLLLALADLIGLDAAPPHGEP